MQTVFFSNISQHLSPVRMESYRPAGGGTDEDCLCRYLWNTALAEALYPSLHLLEVSYRNAAHTAISAYAGTALGTADWLLSPRTFLKPIEQDKLAEAKRFLGERGKPLTEDYVVAELSFGFWTNLLDARYDQIWHKIIKQVFPLATNAERNRVDIADRMNRVRFLRNAASHHHSIWHWKDLDQHHAAILLLTGWISEPASRMAKTLDRFPQVLAAGPESFRPAVAQFGKAPASTSPADRST